MFKQVEIQPWTTIEGTVSGYPTVNLEPELWLDTKGFRQCAINAEISYVYGCCIFIQGINEGGATFSRYSEVASVTSALIDTLSRDWPEGDSRKLRDKIMWSATTAPAFAQAKWTATFRITATLFS